MLLAEDGLLSVLASERRADCGREDGRLVVGGDCDGLIDDRRCDRAEIATWGGCGLAMPLSACQMPLAPYTTVTGSLTFVNGAWGV